MPTPPGAKAEAAGSPRETKNGEDSQAPPRDSELFERLTHLASTIANDGGQKTLKTLSTVVRNLMKRPHETKVRSLRLANPLVHRHLATHPEAVSFLELLGFKANRTDPQNAEGRDAEGVLTITQADARERAVVAQEALHFWCRSPTTTPESANLHRTASTSSIAPSKTACPLIQPSFSTELLSSSRFDGAASTGAGMRSTGDPNNGVISVTTTNMIETGSTGAVGGRGRTTAPLHTWDGVYGHENAHRQLVAAHPSAPFGSAVLLFGPPRCGKTLVAHASASHWGLRRVLTVAARDLNGRFSRTRRRTATGIATTGEGGPNAGDGNGPNGRQQRQADAHNSVSESVFLHFLAYASEVAPSMLLLYHVAHGSFPSLVRAFRESPHSAHVVLVATLSEWRDVYGNLGGRTGDGSGAEALGARGGGGLVRGIRSLSNRRKRECELGVRPGGGGGGGTDDGSGNDGDGNCRDRPPPTVAQAKQHKSPSPNSHRRRRYVAQSQAQTPPRAEAKHSHVADARDMGASSPFSGIASKLEQGCRLDERAAPPLLPSPPSPELHLQARTSPGRPSSSFSVSPIQVDAFECFDFLIHISMPSTKQSAHFLRLKVEEHGSTLQSSTEASASRMPTSTSAPTGSTGTARPGLGLLRAKTGSVSYGDLCDIAESAVHIAKQKRGSFDRSKAHLASCVLDEDIQDAFDRVRTRRFY